MGAACSACGNLLPASSRFCNKCGARVGLDAREEASRAPSFYTPKHLADRILGSRSSLEGERKQVTVLFADLKGSMELLADRDPEEARAVLDPVLQIMMEAVHRYEGTVNQVMGDGIMALFGAPLSHEDHAARACYAALRMQQETRRFSETLRRSRGAEVQIRVGINSGEVVVRAIGSDLRMDYTAVGHTTHLAARMEQFAPPGSIRLTADTYRLVEGFVQVVALGQVPVKGQPRPVEVFELTGATPMRRRFEAATARGLTQFVGRHQELQVLEQALLRAKDGHGQVVAPVGEPGVGKSRLFWEFTHSDRTEGCLVLESGSASYGKATAYLPVIELLRRYFGIEEHDQHRVIREKITGKLLTLDRALEPSLPAFLTLLDVPFEDRAWAALDPPQRRQQTLDGTKRLLLRESQVRPLVLVFEDLHWLDAESQAFLDLFVESIPSARVLLLVNYRPEYRHAWSGKSYYTQLRIDPLAADNAGQLLDCLLGGDATLQPVKNLLIERTEGNPFFLEECVRTLFETRTITGMRGSYRLAEPLHAVQVPATVQAVLSARIDRLQPEEKRLLQAAAVIGDEFRFNLLRAIADEPEGVLHERLASLQAAEFLYEAHLFPDLEYVFKHGLTCQVAYGTLLQERRRDLHAKLVDAIETIYGDRLNEYAELLALHAVRGENWAKAVVYSSQAGSKALARSANQDAVTHFEQALIALQKTPRTRDTLKHEIDLRFNLQASLFPLGELEKMLTVLREAQQLAKALDDPRRLAWALVYGNFVHSQTGRLVQGRELGDQALRLGEDVGDTGLLVVARYYRAQSHLGADYLGAIELYRKNVLALQGAQAGERFGLYGAPAVMSRTWMAWALAERGEFDDGHAVGQEGIRIAESINHPFTLCAALWQVSHLHRIRGDLAATRALLDRSLALAREWNIPLVPPLGAWCRGYLDAVEGRAESGILLLQEAQGVMESMRYLLFQPLVLAHLAEACMLAKQSRQAYDLATKALAAAKERDERGYAAYALKVLGELAGSDMISLSEGEAQLHESLRLAEAMQMRPLMGHVHAALARLHKHVGDAGRAGKHAGHAATLYQSLDMPFWLERARLATTS
jgi:class 3 adenylate cyclase